jgi:hypothetical protein
MVPCVPQGSGVHILLLLLISYLLCPVESSQLPIQLDVESPESGTVPGTGWIVLKKVWITLIAINFHP